MANFTEGFSLYAVAWYVLLYSVLGWIIEVIFCSANTGRFVNRGFLNGPVCPIYGVGGTAVVVLLQPVAGTILPLFVGSVLVTSALELLTGFALKKLFHTRWWDYSKQRFNIGGYICLKFSLAWGVACLLLVRVLHPALAVFVAWIPHTLGIVLLCCFYAVFLTDIIVTVNVILKLNRDLGELTRIAEGLHKQSDSLAQSIGNRAITAADKLSELELPEKLEAQKQKIETGLEASREKWESSIQAQTERMDALRENQRRHRQRMLGAFPDMHSSRYAQALEELKQKYREWQKSDKKSDKKDL